MTTKDLKEEKELEQFLARWSRLKQEANDPPPQKAADSPPVDPKSPPPELPPLDKLTLDSDYRAFFHPKVDEGARRAALKKLFSDPRFNVMDGLDVYIDDYSKTEPIPPEMLAGLKQAQKILEWARGGEPDKEEGAQEHAKRDAAASSQPINLEQRTSPGTPSVAPGEQATKSISGAPDQAPGRPSPENP